MPSTWIRVSSLVVLLCATLLPDRAYGELPLPPSGRILVAAGTSHTLILTDTGQLWAFGLNTSGQPRLATYHLNRLDAALLLNDVPLFYTPPRGPAVDFTLSYHSREYLQPQIFSFGNLGPHWTFSWLGYIEEHPLVVAPLGNIYPEYVMVYLRGGGEERYVGPPAADGSYGVYWRQRAMLTRVSSSPVRYERRLADGGVEVYDLADGAPEGQRRIFLTSLIDPQGHALHFTYDAQLRLVAVSDAVGQVTTLAYEWPGDPEGDARHGSVRAGGGAHLHG